MRSANRGAAAALSILAALAASTAARAAAQSCYDPGNSRPAVYFTGPDNDISCVTDFGTGAYARAVQASGTLFKGLAARFEGEGAGISLVAGSTTNSGDIQVFGCDATGTTCAFKGQAAALSQVSGLGLDTYGNIAAVNDSTVIFVPRCTPGSPECTSPSGYGNVEPLSVTGANGYVDVKWVTNAVSCTSDLNDRYQPGDVLVLAKSPAKILRGRRDAIDANCPGSTWTGGDEVASLPPGTQPTGLALFPTSGEVLVTTVQGPIYVVNRQGAVQATPFTTLSGQGVNAAIGNRSPNPADPANGAEVFVTATNNGRVLRFVAKRDGSSLLADPASTVQIVGTGNPPYGVANATLGDRAWTPAGAGVKVLAVSGDLLTFEKVNTAGFTEGRVYLIPEALVRESGNRITADMVGLPSTFEGRTVPLYVRGYAVEPDASSACAAGLSPSTYASCYFLVHVIDSTADILGSTYEHHIEEHDLGVETGPESTEVLNCYAPGGAARATQPRLFYATDPNDPAIVEGDVFIDISTGCGNSHYARGGYSSGYSLHLTGWDTRVPNDPSQTDIARGKLTAIDTTLSSSSSAAGGLAGYVPRKILSKLRNYQQKAYSAYLRGDTDTAAGNLESLIALVKSSAATFPRSYAGVERNAAGELVARAETALWSLWSHTCQKQRRFDFNPLSCP
ncbi:MAG TPA: hypothetical protein VGB87_02555 [Vicinamibacteria bacterium]